VNGDVIMPSSNAVDDFVAGAIGGQHAMTCSV